MDHFDLSGYDTYRSFLNEPVPVDDVDQILFGEGQLFLYVEADGSIRGTLGFPSDPISATKELMDLAGTVTAWAPPTLELEGIGRSGTGTEDFVYEYRASLAPPFEDAVDQRPALVGTVLRAQPHGSAPAGVTASFIAVKRDFLRQRTIPGVALVPEAVEMLASRRCRLRHAVWHTVRILWHELKNATRTVAEIDERGWWPQRPPVDERGALNLENGAGEDFLFMHRKMIQMLQQAYASAGVPAPQGWTVLPSTDVQQVVYEETTTAAGEKTFVFEPDASGFMVPPPARDDDVDRMLKSATFRNVIMRPHGALFQSPTFLSALTLGQLGNLLEFTIHGWMHARWTRTTYDPVTGEPIGRNSLFDIDPKWDVFSYDDLDDFYSAHVYPLFWHLHGWIDARIEDWARVHASRLKRTVIDGVPWFKADGRLVEVANPFYWPTTQEEGDADVEAIQKVMALMRDVIEPPGRARRLGPLTARRIEQMSAKEAFRAAMLGLSLPDLPQP